MSNASFVTANATRSAALSTAHTTNTRASWHTSKPPAFYAAFYAGYEATWGSTR